MPSPPIAPKPKDNGPMNTLQKLNEEYNLTKKQSQKFSYKSSEKPTEHR
jgi:hypothetical protein